MFQDKLVTIAKQCYPYSNITFGFILFILIILLWDSYKIEPTKWFTVCLCLSFKRCKFAHKLYSSTVHLYIDIVSPYNYHSNVNTSYFWFRPFNQCKFHCFILAIKWKYLLVHTLWISYKYLIGAFRKLVVYLYSQYCDGKS